jgi:uncharacterized protein YbcI
MADEQIQDPIARPTPVAVVAVISREIVGIYAQYYGRGPTKAKTAWHGDLVVCILEDVFTRAEQVLVEGGRFEQVRGSRTAFQDEAQPTFRAAVEHATGRRVEHFLSQVNERGVAAEIFILARDD